MKRNFVVSVFGSLVGFGMLFILLSAAGIVGARRADVTRSDVSRTNDVSAATPLTSTFTYQGQLKNGGSAVNGSCQMAFRLYDALVSGSLIGSPITTTVPVTNGLFTVGLNFGSNAFNGNGRWLDIQVNCGNGFVALIPRQPLTAVPYALFSGNANPALPGPGAAATVDSAGNVGYWTSITIGADGLGLISYYDVTNDVLEVLHCGNAACNSGNLSTTVDSAGNVGYFTSITIGADGLGLISYYDLTNGDLKVLHCGNAACSSGNTATTVDSAGAVGHDTSITIGADGLGLISYRDSIDDLLKVLHCGNAACNSGNISTTVDSAGAVGQYSSITIGADGRGLVSYYDITNGDLKVLHCGNAACSNGNISTTVDSAGNVGPYTSITIGADGRGLVSYRDGSSGVLRVLHCGNAACSSGNTATTVDSAGNVGNDITSITIGADGLGLVSYRDGGNGVLKVLHCGNAACSSGNTATTVDSTVDLGYFTSITIGADGLGLISYYDNTNGDLKVFRCSNLTCTPYTRVGR